MPRLNHSTSIEADNGTARDSVIARVLVGCRLRCWPAPVCAGTVAGKKVIVLSGWVWEQGDLSRDKVTKGVWAEIIRGGHVAQDFAAPSERIVRIDGPPEARKTDVRLYVYNGQILLICGASISEADHEFSNTGRRVCAGIHNLEPLLFRLQFAATGNLSRC